MVNIKETAKKFGVPIIRKLSHDILIEKIKESNPKHILEIGTAIGFSGISMLKNSNADLITIEHNKTYFNQAKNNFKNEKLSKRVKIIFGDCMVELAKMVASKKYDNYFDFIFLDGPKAQYDLMIENLIFMLNNNGVLLVDDVLFHGYNEKDSKKGKRFKTITKRLNQFIENCKNNPELTNFELIDIEDGLIYAKKVNK